MRKIDQSFSVPFCYQVLFTEGLFDTENTCLVETLTSSRSPKPPKLLVVVDQGVRAHHPGLLSAIRNYGSRYRGQFELIADILTVPGGEAAKNKPTLVDTILEAIEAHGIDRHSYVLAVGGGAVLDMVGYAASIAHRGVRLVRAPTTVLSQNDSGIGVKNGINYFGKKNFLGVFDPPFAVINDARFLLTLDERDWRAGVAEAIKVALIKDAAFFEQLEQEAEAIAKRALEPMKSQIFRCAEIHAAHIRGGDPFEKGSSRPLDFGHWAAHKLEQMTGFELRHGEAVAIGIALDVFYSHLSGLLSRESCLRVIRLIEALGFSLFVPELTKNLNQPGHPQSLLGGLEEFREHLGGELTIMLIEEIGRGIEVHEMDTELVIQSARQLERFSKVPHTTSHYI